MLPVAIHTLESIEYLVSAALWMVRYRENLSNEGGSLENLSMLVGWVVQVSEETVTTVIIPEIQEFHINQDIIDCERRVIMQTLGT